jgi:hypothetical protein
VLLGVTVIEGVLVIVGVGDVFDVSVTDGVVVLVGVCVIDGVLVGVGDVFDVSVTDGVVVLVGVCVIDGVLVGVGDVFDVSVTDGVVVLVGVCVIDGVLVGVGEDSTQHSTCFSVMFCIKCVDEPLVSETNLTHFSSPFNSAVKISLDTNLTPLKNIGPFT